MTLRRERPQVVFLRASTPTRPHKAFKCTEPAAPQASGSVNHVSYWIRGLHPLVARLTLSGCEEKSDSSDNEDLGDLRGCLDETVVHPIGRVVHEQRLRGPGPSSCPICSAELLSCKLYLACRIPRLYGTAAHLAILPRNMCQLGRQQRPHGCMQGKASVDFGVVTRLTRR